ncbi:MAG: DUF305 domain-containing protein [Solirubrobacteraceae bacterium]|nr:DUF305 domain-containing protein [Patulibacter sp.]
MARWPDPDCTSGNGDGGRRAKPFDRTLIDTFIPYDQCEIRMARAELAKGHDPALHKVAAAVLTGQPPELTKLNGLRTTWYGATSPAGGIAST